MVLKLNPGALHMLSGLKRRHCQQWKKKATYHLTNTDFGSHFCTAALLLKYYILLDFMHSLYSFYVAASVSLLFSGF